MVEIFKTDITSKEEAAKIICLLQSLFPSPKFNFDLKDIDNILRVEGEYLNVEAIASLLNEKGFECLLLE